MLSCGTLSRHSTRMAQTLVPTPFFLYCFPLLFSSRDTVSTRYALTVKLNSTQCVVHMIPANRENLIAAFLSVRFSSCRSAGAPAHK